MHSNGADKTDLDLIRQIAEAEAVYIDARDAEIAQGTDETWAALEASAETLDALRKQLSDMRPPPPDISGFTGRWGGNLVGRADGRRRAGNMRRFMGVENRR
jgi:hypothetical protein